MNVNATSNVNILIKIMSASYVFRNIFVIYSCKGTHVARNRLTRSEYRLGVLSLGEKFHKRDTFECECSKARTFFSGVF